MQTTPHFLRGRRAMAIVVVTLTAGVGLLAPSDVDGGPRTESEAVADEAQRALDALDEWYDTNRPVHYVRFLRAREHAATLLSAEVEVPAEHLARAWASADEAKQIAMLSALTQLGVPYRNRASEPGVAFDCSGLTIWAYAEAGVELPRVSRDQIRFADDVDAEEAEPGDLVYYPGHISIYLGADLIVHSPNSGNRVEVASVSRRTQAFGDAIAAGASTPIDLPSTGVALD